MTQQQRKQPAHDAWLSTVMPHNNLSTACDTLELHKRLVHLATLRESALEQLGQLDAVKVSLTEKKATQAGRLQAALEARLATALAAVDPHRHAVWDLVKALEKEAAYYSDVLQGLQPAPPSEAWPSLTERYQQLQAKVEQQQAQEQGVQPAQLEQKLAAGLEPCQVGQVQVVEQLRAEVDSLRQQLQQAHVAQQQQQQQVATGAAAAQRDMLALQHQQQHHHHQQQDLHCMQELRDMQQLAALVLQQLQLYCSMQAVATQQHHQQEELCCADNASTQQIQPQHSHNASSVLAECQQLKYKLQQLSQTADALVQGSSSSSHPASGVASTAPGLHGSCCGAGVDADADPAEQQLLQDPLLGVCDPPHHLNNTEACRSSSRNTTSCSSSGRRSGQQQSAGAHTALQELREAMQQPAMPTTSGHNSGCCSVPHTASQQGARLHHAGVQGLSGWWCSNNSSSDCCGSQLAGQQQQLQVTKLRLAYQQMLHKVQSRYQQDLRQLEVKHREALQAQSLSQQQALSNLAGQHQEVCDRLAAAAKGEAGLQQQVAQLRADRKALQQQVDKLQREVAGAAASAIAVVQVQHEQHMLALREEQQQQLHNARQQVEQLQQQLHQLQQQQQTPAAQTVAAMVAEATAKEAEQQQQQLHALQAALQQQEQQHLSLLQDLSDMRQLQEESSGLSDNSSTLLAAHTEAAVTAGGQGGVPAFSGTVQQQSTDIQHLLEDCSLVQRTCTGQQGQQQQHGTKGGDAMNALIAAVLGNGQIGRAQQRAHQERLVAQQQQQQQQHAPGHQQPAERGSTAANTQSELDKLLGLGSEPPSSGATTTGAFSMPPPTSNTTNNSSRSSSPHQRSIVAPVNAALAAAMERARVAATCLPALQDISHSSVCNAAGGSAAGVKSPVGGSSSISNRAPWRPPSPTGCQRKQWQQWQQGRTAAGGRSSGSSRSPSRSPSPTKRRQHPQQQQHDGDDVVLVCVRCGQSESGVDGPCCFHPGLVAAPGPLMYSTEWHACRARCTPDMPGCYTRASHFFAPNLLGEKAGAAAGQQVAAKHSMTTVSAAGAGVLQQQQQQQQPRFSSLSPGRKGVSPPRRPGVVSRGRYVGAARSPPSKASAAAGELSGAPEPRSSLPSPKPSIWRR